MVSTITMPVAAESPPMKTSSASPSAFWTMGSVSTKVSASTSPCGKCSTPPNAIGSTKMLIASMYSGKTQAARLRWRSSVFSITATWNWRGRKMIASMESTVSHTQLA